MTRPESVTVCGQPFAIEWVTPGSTALVESPSLGATNVSEQRIAVLAQDQGPAQERDTVLHEVLHAIVKMTGHREDFRGGTGGEERVVYALATALLAVLRGNPELVAWLVEEVG